MEIMKMSQLYVWTSMSAAQGLILVTLMPSVSTNQGPLRASAKQGTLETEVIVKVSMKTVQVQNSSGSNLSVSYILLVLFTENLAVTLTHGR
jgi:hypothetical protein